MGKKILFISHSNFIGGAELCFIETLKALQSKGYVVYAVFPAHEGKLKSVCEPLCEAAYTQFLPLWIENENKLSFKTKFNRLLNIIASVRKSVRLIKSINPDIIITNTSVIPEFGVAAKFTKTKHVWFIHELVDKGLDSYFVFGKSFSKKIISYCSDIVIVNSKFIESHYFSFVKKENLKLLYQPAEMDFANDNIVEKSDKILTLLIIGKVSKFKGQKQAVLACKELNKSNIDFKLLIVGAQCSSYVEELNSLISDDLTDKIEFIPFTSEPSVYYQLSDIVLVCSKCEALGRVTIEAMKMGLPVIASNQGGNLELIQDGVNGYLYELGNPIDLANKIVLLQDANKRNEMGEKGRKIANDTFNMTSYEEELDKILIKLCSE